MRRFPLLIAFVLIATQLVAQDCDNDETPPVFSSTPEDQTIACTDQIGEQAVLYATDDCDENVTVIATSTTTVNNEVCEFTNTSWPNSEQPAAFKIFLNNNESIFMEVVDILFNETFEIDGSSSILMTGTFKEHDSEGGFIFTIRLENGMNWDQWSNQDYATDYHGDSGANNGEHLDWRYYLMNENSYLEGWGTWENTNLHLSHAPENYYYCFQKGMGANNTAYVPGIGGWFYATGMHNGEDVQWQGDIALEMNCCTEQTVLNEWTATDSSGNTSTVSQTITTNSLVGLPINNCAGDFDSDNVVGTLDLLHFLGKFGCSDNCGDVDFNQNNLVESADLLFMVSRIGGLCN